MTVIADNKKRVTLPTKPGERFDLQAQGGDKFILTRLAPVKPVKARVSITKEAGYTVGRLGHPVDADALKQALEEFP
jgi:hypothetical protein